MNAEGKLIHKCKRFLSDVKRLQEELKEIRCDHWGNDLCGACAFSAYIIFRYAKALGLDSVFRYTPHHCWCLVENVIVDATAIQFEKLHPYLNKNDILIQEDENVYGFSNVISLTKDSEIFRYTEDWEDQGPSFLLEKFSKRLLKRLGEDFCPVFKSEEFNQSGI